MSAKIDLTRQAKDNTLVIDKLVVNFLNGTDWNITNGNNNATITGLKSPVNPKDAATKEFVEGFVGGSVLKSPDNWNLVNGLYPTLYKGSAVKDGDTFYITTSGNIGGNVANIGDLLISKADTPGQTDANWFMLESNRSQATEVMLGVSKIATQALVSIGDNDTDYITPRKLNDRLNALLQSLIISPNMVEIIITQQMIDNGYVNIDPAQIGQNLYTRSVVVYFNGVALRNGCDSTITNSDYEVAGDGKITLSDPLYFEVGDSLIVQYVYTPSGA